MPKPLFVLLPLSAAAAAEVPGQKIHGQPDAPLAAEVLGMQVHTSDPEEMRCVILRELTERYAADNRIEV